jgi:hypothetical protein
MNTLLLTACINSGVTPYVTISNPDERLSQYIGFLMRWIKESNFDRLIFCENSNYPYDYNSLIEEAKTWKKELEILVFDGNNGAQKHGKGYGEGETLKYAIEHSRFLIDADSFYKATGRVFVKNINKLLTRDNAKDNIFLRYDWSYHAVDTRFFKSNVAFFKSTLMNEYLEVDDVHGSFLEYIYWNRLKKLDLPRFYEFPEIIGVSATHNVPYTLTKAMLFRNNVSMKIGLFNVHESLFYNTMILIDKIQRRLR